MNFKGRMHYQKHIRALFLLQIIIVLLPCKALEICVFHHAIHLKRPEYANIMTIFDRINLKKKRQV